MLVMEYVGGATLGSLIEKHGAFPPKSVGQFLYAMLGHLDQLHSLGIIHRDIKPENIKRTDDNRYVLLDFGIAKRATSTEIVAKAFLLSSHSLNLFFLAIEMSAILPALCLVFSYSFPGFPSPKI